MAGYDISAAVSEGTTQGYQSSIGAFTVGGGGKAASLWPIVLGVVAIAVAWLLLRRK